LKCIELYSTCKACSYLYVKYFTQVEREQAEAAMREGEPQAAAGNLKRPKLNTIGVGKGSGRAAWKQPAPRANTLKNPKLSSSWDKKMKDKAERAAYVSLKREATESKKTAAKEARERREEAQRRKEENRKKSAITTKVSSATARKMMKNKKLKKKLVMVDG
jgi:rRNA-processing protein CGR1